MEWIPSEPAAKLLVWLISLVAAAVVGVALDLLLREPLLLLLSRVMSPLLRKGNRSVAGVWACAYRYVSKEVELTEYQVVVLRQFGNVVVGQTCPASERGQKDDDQEQQVDAGQGDEERRYEGQGAQEQGAEGRGPEGQDLHTQNAHRQRLSGRFRAPFDVTGTWENLGQQAWHGAFQFRLHADGDHMLGRWLGFDSTFRVQTGWWAWVPQGKQKRAPRPEQVSAILAENKEKLGRLLEGASCAENKQELKRLLDADTKSVRQLISAYHEACQNREPERLDEIFAEDATYQEHAFKPAHHGINAIKDYWRDRKRRQRNIKCHLQQLDAYDNHAVAKWQVEFDEHEEGQWRRKTIREVALIVMKDKKIASIEEYSATQSTDLRA